MRKKFETWGITSILLVGLATATKVAVECGRAAVTAARAGNAVGAAGNAGGALVAGGMITGAGSALVRSYQKFRREESLRKDVSDDDGDVQRDAA